VSNIEVKQKIVWLWWPGNGVTCVVGEDGRWYVRQTGPFFKAGQCLGPCVRGGKHVLQTDTRQEIRWRSMPDEWGPVLVARFPVYRRITGENRIVPGDSVITRGPYPEKNSSYVVIERKFRRHRMDPRTSDMTPVERAA
jgi:hypothetical protein